VWIDCVPGCAHFHGSVAHLILCSALLKRSTRLDIHWRSHAVRQAYGLGSSSIAQFTIRAGTSTVVRVDDGSVLCTDNGFVLHTVGGTVILNRAIVRKDNGAFVRIPTHATWSAAQMYLCLQLLNPPVIQTNAVEARRMGSCTIRASGVGDPASEVGEASSGRGPGVRSQSLLKSPSDLVGASHGLSFTRRLPAPADAIGADAAVTARERTLRI